MFAQRHRVAQNLRRRIETLVSTSCRNQGAAWSLTKSLSVRIPTTLAPSTTTRQPIFFSNISRAASTSMVVSSRRGQHAHERFERVDGREDADHLVPVDHDGGTELAGGHLLHHRLERRLRRDGVHILA